MTDLAVLAVGFGVIPLAAIGLYSLSDVVERHREMSWGLLVGILAFLGLSHSMALVLLNHSLFGEPAAASLVSFIGLVFGASLAWVLLEGPFIRTEPNRILWASVAFVGLHSFGDGLVLGADFLGGFAPVIRVDTVTVSATVVHRFVEGCIVVIPALAALWKGRSAFVVLTVSLVAIPAAYIPGWTYQAFGFTPTRSLVALSLPTFLGAMEAGLALLLLFRAFVRMASVDRGTRWLAWTVVGFIGIALVHFFVE
ncbi:MAG TPA: hypothetical protein VJP06_04130 [Thermoplasmata archaeon]|nr:hypothetical protein [Thermoplasmata archaeon]